MNSPQAARSPLWLVLLAAAGTFALTMGTRQTMGLFLSPINTSTGLGLGSISLAFAFGQLFWGLTQPFAGAVADRIGAGRVLLAGVLLVALGTFITPLMTSTVGLISMHIIGSQDGLPFDEATTQHAIELGVALQLTNILRDVGEDLARGRIYLPLEDLAAFDYHEADLIAQTNDERFKRLMRFQIERTEGLYRDHLHGLAQLKADGRMAVGSAILLYRGILGRIVENDFDVFSRRARLSTFEKLARLPAIYRQVQRLSLLNPQVVR